MMGSEEDEEGEYEGHHQMMGDSYGMEGSPGEVKYNSKLIELG
jgi:hypothetical protein